MALNKSMHPRNRYKDKPPDFAYLASKYPEFQQHVHTNLTGRVGLNFKDPEAVRALTCTLLKEDFGLSIEIPLERLIPTVPLRLNYIHWVEDLIGGRGEDPGGTRRGIDIGTGASCIYPLLGATMNGWFFLATEVDDICFNFAKKNVENNGLSDLIKVVKVPQKTLLMDALKEESALVYDFCMCNPPFFANQLEAKGVNSRNSRRPPPSSVNTGGVTEIMAEGGELEFVKRIIHDSLQLKGRLRWYSCMLGKKCSLAPLKEELRKHGVPRVTHTEFCQGRTMRWALAWSFYDDVAVPSPPCKKRKLEKARKPLTFSVLRPTVKLLEPQRAATPAPCPVELITAWLEKTLTELKVCTVAVPGEEEVELSLFLTAVENSWVHIRQRRRDHGRQLRELPRAREGPEEVPVAVEQEAESGTPPSGPAQPPSPGSVQHFLFKCLLSVREEGGSGDVGVQMHWVEGQNRDLMNQLCTYLKNTLHRLASAPPAPPLASP
ncbi:LOW QUALITY PROTEIN: RNA N6-adenosine-methyltransferase mettl16 [Anguilla anguilla]|uniref:LOW QUALITY PROTEIN: RNA N6-adenosine-methyltransferase mettl16 n=1 Tax=Anguilla anguilla TaxID=7936 RepID=UPI0015AB2F23|nr:LOW QUALITY PROTEIN: RNA N6-adenosine-methyltransferase mettl16 [Anguilla anguilla]